MRTLLAVIFACSQLAQAQDARLLKAVEPKYGSEFATDFEVVSATVSMTVMASGKPLALNSSSVPLPMAVVMALKDYEFRAQEQGPHGQGETEVGTYSVTLTVPVRQSREFARRAEVATRVNPGIAKGLLEKQVPPVVPEFARHNHIQGPITLTALINQVGEAEYLATSAGPFALLEAANDAVRQWQWRVYLLNRQPVEVLTEIPIPFN